MLHQPEFVYQRGIVELLCTPFQLRLVQGWRSVPARSQPAMLLRRCSGLQKTDNGEERLVEPFSRLLSLQLPFFVALEFVLFPQMVGLPTVSFEGR